MTKEGFERLLQSYQTSSAPIDVKERAIQKLQEEYYSSMGYLKMKELLAEIDSSSSELKSDEIY